MACGIDCIRGFRQSLRVIEREVAGIVKNGGSCCGVSLAQCHVLLELEARESVSLTDLSAAMFLDKSTLSRTVETMVNEGTVERVAFPGDRREVRICLSDKGRTLAVSINDECDSYYTQLFDHIPKAEHASVVKALSSLSKGITSMKGSGEKECCAAGGKK